MKAQFTVLLPLGEHERMTPEAVASLVNRDVDVVDAETGRRMVGRVVAVGGTNREPTATIEVDE